MSSSSEKRFSCRRSRSASTRCDSSAIPTRESSAAFPKPTMPGTLSVPDRIPRSWPPPSMIGARSTWIAAPDVERADALRAVHLVRAQRGHVHVQFVDVERHLADDLHGIGVKQDPFLFRDRANL